MRNKKTNYKNYIHDLNSVVMDFSRGNQLGDTYIHLLRPDNGKKLNISGSFENAIFEERNQSNSFDESSKKSFGMVATETFEKYFQLIFGEESPFKNKDSFIDFVNCNYTSFCADYNEFVAFYRHACHNDWIGNEYLVSFSSEEQAFEIFRKALFARCILHATMKGSICFYFEGDNADYETVVDILESDTNIFILDLSGNQKQKESERIKRIRISGRIQAETLFVLSKSYGIKLNNEDFSVGIIPLNYLTGQNVKVDSFLHLYDTDYSACYQYNGSALYSGVIPRMCSIEKYNTENSNRNIQQMKLQLGRTSFLTISGLESVDMLESPLLDATTCGLSLREINFLYDKLEVKNQIEYHRTNVANDLALINRYLQNSWNVHNINVSGNVITSDNYCIYTKRACDIEDSGQLYCSVNGGSEIFDSSVSFYNESDIDELPTIKYSGSPVYFGNELSREAVEELGLMDVSPLWNYFGVVVMGADFISKTSNAKHTVWLHFNILAERQCLDSFDQIEINRRNAPEKFENSKIFGYNLQVFSSIGALISNYSLVVLREIMDNTDIISLVGLFFALRVGRESFSIESILSIVFGSFGIALILFRFLRWLKSRKTKANVRIYWSGKKSDIIKILKTDKTGLCKKKNPVYLMLLGLRYESLYRE